MYDLTYFIKLLILIKGGKGQTRLGGLRLLCADCLEEGFHVPLREPAQNFSVIQYYLRNGKRHSGYCCINMGQSTIERIEESR